MEPKNITVVLPQLYSWLKDDGAKDSLAVQTVLKHTKGDEEGKSLALRELIHLVGDLHQPLHTSDRYTKEHPEGDKGGNEFALKYHY